MSKKEDKKQKTSDKKQNKAEEQAKVASEEHTENTTSTEEKEVQEEDLNVKLAELNDKHLRLQAEFNNYRKRTLNEKMELLKSGGEDIIVALLPLLDNFERAISANEKTDDVQAIKEGIDLIYNSFKDFFNKKGVKEIEAVNKPFDTDFHEALTKVPAPSKDLKGKVIDVIEKGYTFNDKVIRFSKVVVGE